MTTSTSDLSASRPVHQPVVVLGRCAVLSSSPKTKVSSTLPNRVRSCATSCAVRSGKLASKPASRNCSLAVLTTRLRRLRARRSRCAAAGTSAQKHRSSAGQSCRRARLARPAGCSCIWPAVCLQGAQKARRLVEFVDVGDVAHVALDEGIDVLARPGGAAPTRWPGHGLGVAAAQHALDQRLAHGRRAGLEDAASRPGRSGCSTGARPFRFATGAAATAFPSPAREISHGGQCHQVGQPGKEAARRYFIHAFLDSPAATPAAAVSIDKAIRLQECHPVGSSMHNGTKVNPSSESVNKVPFVPVYPLFN